MRKRLFIALSPLAALVALSLLVWAYAAHKNRTLAEMLRRAAACGTKAECTGFMGEPRYDFPTDDETGAERIKRFCGRQHTFPAQQGLSVAFYRGGGIPERDIFVLYDRTSGRVVRVGAVRL